MLRFLSVTAIVPFLAFAGFAGCGAGDVSPPPLIAATNDGGSSSGSSGGTDSSVADAPPGATIQSGKVIDFSTTAPVPGAVVTVGAHTVTTDATGSYQLQIDPNTVTSMTVTKDGFYSLQEQQSEVTTTFNLGKTKFLSNKTANLLTTTLTSYDGTGGIVSVSIELQGCADETGATFTYTVDGQPAPSTTKLIYANSGFPDSSLTSAQAGSFPHAVIYNITPGKPVAVTVTHPTCKMKPYPVVKDLEVESGSGTITYTSATLAPIGGKATSFVRVFLTN